MTRQRLTRLLWLFWVSSSLALTQSSFSQQAQGYAKEGNCRACHRAEFKAWQKSDHAHAMQKATANNVLGNFNNARFDYFGEVTQFTHKDGKYTVTTIGKDGKSHTYPVKYTFGHDPLQQYLLDVGHGQLQAFTIAWDVKKKRWFHLYPDSHIKASDPLHWSRRFFNWNHNCASCHSSDFEKNFDANKGAYHSQWAEINVGCQSCHGPGQAHIEWAKDLKKTLKVTGSRGQAAGRRVNKAAGRGDGQAAESNERKRDPNKGFSPAYASRKSKKIVKMCASCHSRRHRIAVDDNYDESFYNKYMPELLRQGLYHADGQINDEVFVLGSFMQSKMYQRGVTCINCHRPHSLKLRIPGNGLCLQCHNTNSVKPFKGLQSKNYDSPEHTHHPKSSPGSQCVNCHMPQKIYMQKDRRYDHSFRIPRPDLSIKTGSPNACTQCHQDKSPQWALKQIQAWTGKKTFPTHYGEIFHRARNDAPQALDELITLARDKSEPAIVRATAIEYLGKYPAPKSVATRIQALDAKDPMIRAAAVSALQSIAPNQRLTHLLPLLNDPNRAVRIEAARLLAEIPKTDLPQDAEGSFDKALKEYQALQQRNLDMPDAHYNLGLLSQHQGLYESAIDNYQNALKLDKSFYPASQSLARLYHAQGNKEAAIDTLGSAIENNASQGELYYSLGLLFAEQNDWLKATPMLEKASRLLPSMARVQYNHGLALMNLGDLPEAARVLEHAHQISANSTDILYALTLVYMRQQLWDKAHTSAQKLHQLAPDSPQYRRLLRYIEQNRS